MITSTTPTPSKIIISEGLFTLTPKVVDAFDFKIYVHVSQEAQKERFYRRAEERGLGSSMDEVYNNAASKAKIYIHPTAESADIILSGEASKPKHTEGVVIAIGEGKLLDNGKRHPLNVEVGQRVIYNGFGGTKVSHQGKELVILSQDDILAIVE